MKNPLQMIKAATLILLILVLVFFTVSLMTYSPSAKADSFDIDKYLSKTYVTIGAGYKFHEASIIYRDDNGKQYEFDDPYSARFEIGYYYNKNVKFGISHHSQWSTGAPFNDRDEYFKTEIFIDYTFTLR